VGCRRKDGLFFCRSAANHCPLILWLSAAPPASYGNRGNGAINALFEDREGNVWVGGARGLGRIRDTVFVTFSSATDSRIENTGPIYVDAEGRT
jgi:ligand-binding sensor domain-containing protein